MARASRVAKAASRAAIIDTAGCLFRENGIEATSVSDVMAAAGLTHGGFYRHFGSKEELVATAVTKAADNIASGLAQDIAELGARRAVRRYVDMYLSEEHVTSRAEGCPIAALSEELGRGPARFRSAITQGTNRMIDLFAQGLGGQRRAARKRASALLATLVGSIVLARSETSDSRRKEILRAGRKLATEQFSD